MAAYHSRVIYDGIEFPVSLMAKAFQDSRVQKPLSVFGATLGAFRMKYGDAAGTSTLEFRT
jgi:hypothetical protein